VSIPLDDGALQHQPDVRPVGQAESDAERLLEPLLSPAVVGAGPRGDMGGRYPVTQE